MNSDPPVYFRSLELQNVRCFGTLQQLDLTGGDGNPVQWTLVLGDNGVGKTTLLQCLAWMAPVPWIDKDTGGIAGIEPVLSGEENKVWDSLIRTGDNVDVILAATLTADRAIGGESRSEPAELKTRVEMQGSFGVLQTPKNTESAANRSSFELISDLAMFAYGATRRPGTLIRDGDELSNPLASLFSESTELYDAEDILLKLDHGAKSDTEQDARFLRDVKRLLAAVLPDVADEEQIEIRPPRVFGSRREYEGVTFKTPYGKVPISALSLGYQTTLTWITDLALRLYHRYPESSNPLSEPGIVLIDNIDLHLHPHWQRRMMTDITRLFPAVQFIATAHSPLIVQAAENAKLVVLRELDGEVVIDDDHELVNTWRVDQILSSELFGVPVRSEYIEDLRKERNSLADLPDRSGSEESRLRYLREELDKLPTAEDPGYYWLAYDWKNLLVSCETCNTCHKGSLFPLVDEDARARCHHDNLEDETPFFVDPANESPAQHVRFRRAEIEHLSDRGQKTIQGLGLRRPELEESRAERLTPLEVLLEFLHDVTPDFAGTVPPAHVENARKLLSESVRPEAEFSAMMRDFLGSHEGGIETA